ncbi:MAG: NAD(P)H-dependent flavin oxidoreductase [Wujia sp.]
MCKIRNYNLQIPIIQGGMGVGVSLGHLAGAVAKEGGMGVISTVNAGYLEKDFESNPHEANIRALKNEIQYALRESNGNGMVAINAMVAVNNYDETIKAAVEAGVEAIISGAGLPINLPKLVEGTNVAIAPIVSSGKAARIILKSWEKDYKRIPDFIVIEGPLAGGHLGFKKDAILSGTTQSTDEILPDVLWELAPYEQKYGIKIPVFVAGGVFDGYDMARLVAKGATGVQIATRFIATEECDASPVFKQMMISATPEDVTIVPSPVGLPGRALKTPLINHVLQGEKFPAKRCNLCLKACSHGENIPYCISHALIEAVKGNVEEGLFFCGANVGRINKMTTVAELMDEIMTVYNTELNALIKEENPA